MLSFFNANHYNSKTFPGKKQTSPMSNYKCVNPDQPEKVCPVRVPLTVRQWEPEFLSLSSLPLLPTGIKSKQMD